MSVAIAPRDVCHVVFSLLSAPRHSACSDSLYVLDEGLQGGTICAAALKDHL